MELLRPPSGRRLDVAVLTTYTLDLEALLALPFAVMAHADGGVEELLEDPLLLLQGLREAGERVHVFVDETGIAVPRRQRNLYATLENSVHMVRAPRGGVFHPKVWLARFVPLDQDGDALIRVAVLSRNLTYDKSWDIALVSETKPETQLVEESAELGTLIGDLSTLCRFPPSRELIQHTERLTSEVTRCAFPAPNGFVQSPIAFHTMGLPSAERWRPRIDDGRRVLAVAPFVGTNALNSIRGFGSGEGHLISRPDELDRVPQSCLEQWSEVRVLADAMSDEIDDESSSRPSGLHAKIIAIEDRVQVTWFVGSANLTSAALEGHNVELMASIRGRKSEVGIAKFLDEFDSLCESYRRTGEDVTDNGDGEAEKLLDRAVRALVEKGLKIACSQAGDLWNWCLDGEVELPPGVHAHFWPISMGEEQSLPLTFPSTLTLPVSRLTAFTGFRFHVDDVKYAERRIVLKLPMTGAPPYRSSEILRSVIDSPERLLAFLRALLGGLEQLGQLGDDSDKSGNGGVWRTGFGDETLLEDLLRTAYMEPERLSTVRRLISDLQSTEEGRQILPERLLTVWQAVETAIDVTRRSPDE